MEGPQTGSDDAAAPLAEHCGMEDFRAGSDRRLLWPTGGLRLLPCQAFPSTSSLLNGPLQLPDLSLHASVQTPDTNVVS